MKPISEKLKCKKCGSHQTYTLVDEVTRRCRKCGFKEKIKEKK